MKIRHIPTVSKWDFEINGVVYLFEAHRHRLDNGDWYEYLHVFKKVEGFAWWSRPVKRFYRSVTEAELMEKLNG